MQVQYVVAFIKAGCNANPVCHARGLTTHTVSFLHKTAYSRHT